MKFGSTPLEAFPNIGPKQKNAYFICEYIAGTPGAGLASAA